MAPEQNFAAPQLQLPPRPSLREFINPVLPSNIAVEIEALFELAD